MVILLIIILVILAAPYVYQHLHKDNTINFKDFDKDVALLNSAKDNGTSNYPDKDGPLSDEKTAHPVLFVFNPNNLPAEQWKQLGLSERQISIIKHYESKGGHFSKKEDVQKIYGITADDYKRVEPYINIPGKEFTSNKAAPGEVIEINGADSVKLTRIRGIGPAFAARIIVYRQRLGGFLNKEQLKEVYGIDMAKYAEIKNEVSINPAHITKIKINEVDFEGLRKFPYLTNKQTNAVIQYRKQHGDYQSVADMKNIAILDDIILRKIEPYLVFK
ncbi:MAG: Helix-hairpin-helix motif protein [Mucilaginibacter sp.]|nr:Helix-hairpin-helix motif protein [Mucilaginibacter sp.]